MVLTCIFLVTNNIWHLSECLSAIADLLGELSDFPLEVTCFGTDSYKPLLESRFDWDTKITQPPEAAWEAEQCWIAAARVHPWLVPDLKGRASSLSLNSKCEARGGLFSDAFIPGWGSSLIPNLLSNFIPKSAKFYQMLCLYLLKWSCGFVPWSSLGTKERLGGTSTKICDPKEKPRDDTSQLFWTISITGRAKGQRLQ